MRGGSVAKRYATALIGVAKEKGSLEEIYRDLDRLLQEIQQRPDLKTVLNSPVVPSSQKKGLMEALEKKLAVDPAVGNLIRVLIDQGRMEILSLLAMLYRDMADDALGRVRVRVRVAAAMGAGEAKLKGILERALGKQVILETTVDREILGGLVVQVKDKVFDASLKREVDQIKENIIEKVVA